MNWLTHLTNILELADAMQQDHELYTPEALADQCDIFITLIPAEAPSVCRKIATKYLQGLYETQCRESTQSKKGTLIRIG